MILRVHTYVCTRIRKLNSFRVCRKFVLKCISNFNSKEKDYYAQNKCVHLREMIMAK